MARYIDNLNECTDPVSGDYTLLYDNSAGATDKDRKVNISRFAILANAQSFTGQQTFAPGTTGLYGTIIAMPASTTADALYISYNSAYRCGFNQRAGLSQMLLGSADLGNAAAGPTAAIGNNTNATVPAAGTVTLYNRSGTGYPVWADASGNLRIHTAAPTSAVSDTAGTVVGTQTSYAALKEDIEPWDDMRMALDAILACRLFSYRFKSDESQRQYHGLVIADDDRGAWFSENDGEHQTPVLNERNLFGYLIAAIKALQAEIDELRKDK